MDIAQDSNLVLFFGDLGQSNTLSEIKPPLKRQAILSFIYFSDRYDTGYRGSPPNLYFLTWKKPCYSDLPNNHAANLIIFWEKKTPTQPY